MENITPEKIEKAKTAKKCRRTAGRRCRRYDTDCHQYGRGGTQDRINIGGEKANVADTQ